MSKLLIIGVETAIKTAMKNRGKVEWLQMETALRNVLAARENNELNDYQTLNYISEVIGAFTGRGFPEVNEK